MLSMGIVPHQTEATMDFRRGPPPGQEDDLLLEPSLSYVKMGATSASMTSYICGSQSGLGASSESKTADSPSLTNPASTCGYT